MPGGKANFERLLDGATSAMLLEPNWVTNLEICDSIRQNDVSPNYALASIRKRLKDSNPHVCKFTLVVLETCVKNCGEGFHDELASHEFMNEMRNLAQTGHAPVKEQVLSMLQAWNHAFRNNTKYQPILATYNLMKMEGYEFPALNESDAMFSSDTAPTWKEGDVCHLCRVKFGTFTRQHHCRACGEVFCNSCSSKKSIIAKLGIEREVRVCDPCFDEINPNAGNSPSGESSRKDDDESESDLPAEYLNSALAKESQTKPKLSEGEVKEQEEDELQLALALSLSQEEAKKSTKKNWSAPASTSSSLYSSISSAPPSSSSASSYTSTYSSTMESLGGSDRQQSSELDKYLDRSYWEKKKLEVSRTPTAPIVVEQPPPQQLPPQQQPVTNGVIYTKEYEASGQDQEVEEEDDEEQYASDAFVNTMEKSIDMFVQHMSKAQMKGKHIAMDTSVQSLFHSLSAMHPQLLQLIEDEEESKAKYEAMLNKLAVIREARETLNDMRAQHEEKTKQQELEQEMLRRMQMEQKLELMRQQKQEYLEYQRQLQIQRQMDLDVYQRDKLIQKQVPIKVPPQMMGAYINGYSSYPQSTSIQQQYPGTVPQPPSADALDGDIMPPPPYSTLQGNKPTGTVVPNMSYQDNMYQNVQIQPQSQQQQQPYNQATAQNQPLNQGQWNQPPVSMKQHQQQPLPPQYQTGSQQPPTQQLPPQQLPPQQLPPQQLPPQQLPPQQLPPQQLPQQMLPQQVAGQPPVIQQAPPAPGQSMQPQQPTPMPPPSQSQYQQPGFQQQPPVIKQAPQQQQPSMQQAPHHQVPPQHQQMVPQQQFQNMPPGHQQQIGQPPSHQQPQAGLPPSHQQAQFGQPPSQQQPQVGQPPMHQQFQTPQYQDQNNQQYQQQQQYYAQPPYEQPPPSQPPAPQYEKEMSANMKDLQLISFD